MSEPESHLRRHQPPGSRTSRSLSRFARIAATGTVLALLLAPGLLVLYRITVPKAVSESAPASTSAPSQDSAATRPTQSDASHWNSAGFPSPINVAPSNLIATPNGPTPAYADSTTATVIETIPSTWSGGTSALPVIAQKDQRVEVRLLQRPNGGTAWLALSSVSLTYTPYHLFVDLSTNQLLLYDKSKLVLRAPAGVGTPQYPTPTGNYFVALLAQSPNPGYGPFVIVTSAFADTITDWEQDGNPMIAITGPLDSGAAIGAGGAQVSRGSVRLLGADLSRLRNVPAGTPVDVVAALRPPVPSTTPAPPLRPAGSPGHLNAVAAAAG